MDYNFNLFLTNKAIISRCYSIGNYNIVEGINLSIFLLKLKH